MKNVLIILKEISLFIIIMILYVFSYSIVMVGDYFILQGLVQMLLSIVVTGFYYRRMNRTK